MASGDTPNSTSRESLDKTCLSSIAYKEFKAAKLTDLGEYQFVVDWDPAIPTFDDGLQHTFLLTYPKWKVFVKDIMFN